MSKILISAKIHESTETTEYISLLKENDEYYLLLTMHGWKKISEIQKNWDLLASKKYYIDKTIVPLIYYILATNPQQDQVFDQIFEFLYKENFITYEEENQ